MVNLSDFRGLPRESWEIKDFWMILVDFWSIQIDFWGFCLIFEELAWFLRILLDFWGFCSIFEYFAWFLSSLLAFWKFCWLFENLSRFLSFDDFARFLMIWVWHCAWKIHMATGKMPVENGKSALRIGAAHSKNPQKKQIEKFPSFTRQDC